MGFLDELLRGAQETAARAYNQANPFDGGKNWNTPVARPAQRPQQRPQQQRPQPQFSPQVQQRLAQQDMALKQSQAAVLNPMNVLGDISRAAQTAGQGLQGVVTGTINGLGNRVADFGEAGAEVIREATGQNQAAFEQQNKMAAEYRRMAAGFAQRAQQERDPARRQAYIDQINSLAMAESDLMGTQAQDLTRGLNATDPRKTLTNAAETALDVVTAGRGAALMKGLQPAATQVTGQTLKQLGVNTLRVGGEGAGLGAAYGGINTARDENATLQDYARNMGTGAAIGAAAGVGAQAVLPVAGAAIRGGANQVRKGVELHNSLTPAQRQGGFIAGPKALGFKDAEAQGKVFDGVDGAKRFEVSDKESSIANINGKTLGDALKHDKLFKQYPELKDVPIEYDMAGYLGPASAAVKNLPNGKLGLLVNPYLLKHPEDFRRIVLHETQHVIQAKEGFARGSSPDIALAAFNKDFDNKHGQELVDIQNKQQEITSNPRFKARENEINDIYKRLFNGNVDDPALNARAEALSKLQEPFNKALRELDSRKRAINGKRISDMDAYERTAGEAEARAVEARMNMTEGQRTQSQFYDSLDVPKDELIVRKDGGVAMSVETKKKQLPRQERGLKGNVTAQDITTPAVRESLNLKDMSYQVRNTKNLQIKAKNLVKDSEDAALQLARTGNDDKAVATGMELLKKYQKEGNFEKAIDLVENMAPKLTEIGRAAQAASIYGRLTPAGSLRFTQRQIDKYNADAGLVGKDRAAKLSPERAKQITDLSERIQKLPDGEERTKLTIEMVNLMQSAAPTPTLTKIMNIWRAGLLTSARTLEGGVLGNATKLALDLPAQTVAAGIDKFVTAPMLNKGVRSNVVTVKGGAQGFKEGLGHGKELLKTGIDSRDVSKGYDTKPMNLEDGSKTLNTLGKGADYVYRAMGTVDNPFYYSALRRAQTEQAMIEASKRGIKGKDKKNFVEQFRKNLDSENQARAVAKAEEAVFQNDTSLGTIAAKLKNAPQHIKDPQSRAAAQAMADFLIPFVKIPSAVATALVDYSPAGPLIQVAKQGFKRELDVENLNKAIGKGTVGTIGGVWTGATLYNAGLLTLEAPSDADERQLWELEGKQPFSIKIGDSWRKLNYVQPLGSLMAVGGGFVRAQERKEGNPLVAATAAGLKSVADQSFLKGVSGAMAAVQDPSQSAQTFVNSTAGSVVPNIVRDIARATDSKERETNTPLDALRAGIPGLRQQNLEKRDPFGRSIDTKQSPVGVMLDPFKSTKSKTDPVTAEIRRLYDIDPTNPDYRSAPSALKKQQTFDGQKAVLTPEQLNQYKKLVGEPAFETIKTTVASPEYQRLSDADKAKKISDLISATRNNNKADFVKANTLKDKEGNVLDFSDSKFETKTVSMKPTKATTSSSASKSTEVAPTLAKNHKDTIKEFDALSTEERDKKFYKENDAEFRYEAALYENKKANGTLTKAEQIKAESKLETLQIGSKFSKEARELYSLNKTQLTSLIDKGELTNKQAEEILALNDAMAAAGKTNKFRDKYGNVAIRPKAKGSGGGRKKGTGKGKGSRGGKSTIPTSTVTASLVSFSKSANNAAKNAKVAKKQLPTGTIRRPGIKAYKKTAKTNVSMTRKA